MNELLAACGAFVFVYMLKPFEIFKALNRKPFTCEVCLAGWFALILNLETYWLHIPFRMSAAMILAFVLTKLLRKI